MRRIVLWAAGTVAALVLLLGYPTSLSSTMAASSTQTPYTSTGPPPSATSAARRSGTAAAKGSGPATSREVNGDVVQTAWGPVQVQLTMRGATIASVSVLQYPDGNPRDAQINAYALPILIQETTRQQGAHIDMVSGATYTSTGYIQSLQSALDNA